MATSGRRTSDQPSMPPSVRSPRNKAAAARLRVALDKKLGVETPDWIRELAQTKAS